MSDLQEIQTEIGDWAAETFGDPAKRVEPAFTHLCREVAELGLALGIEVEFKKTACNPIRASVRPGPEFADVFILLCNLARGKGVDLESEIEKKMDKNRRRKWAPPDSEGVIEHDRSRGD